MRKNRLPVSDYVSGILEGNKVILSRAITLVESNHPDDNDLADEVLERVLHQTGKSIRVGITGVPGVGKSTLIESLGQYITSTQQKKLAVLAIDPSSRKSGGSILGDKTRMEQLSHDPLAYIRPSATGDTLGGVANKTRETLLLCEAAGYEVILVETVGVGQSETAVKGMVDFFLLLMLAGAGDELQGIKKGIMEMADAIAITKADGNNQKQAKQAAREYQNALHLFPLSETGWQPKVTTCSALGEDGMDRIWELILEHKKHMESRNLLDGLRSRQNVDWLHDNVLSIFKYGFYQNKDLKSAISEYESKVAENKIAARRAAKYLFDLYLKN